MVPSVVTSAHASHLASPQGKSRSTSNAPEYIPYTTSSSGIGHSSSVNDVSTMGVKHGVLHFNKSTSEQEGTIVSDHDPWKTNHTISNNYSKAHSIPLTTSAYSTVQSPPQTTSTAYSQKVSSEISAEASFRSVSSANSWDNYEDFSPVHSAMNKDLLMQAYDTAQQHTDQMDPSMSGINMTNSVSSQGPLFEMLQSPQVSPLSAKKITSTVTDKSADPFAVNANISCNSHSRRRADSRDIVAQATSSHADPFAEQSGDVSKVGAALMDDRMSDDILPSSRGVVAPAHNSFTSNSSTNNNPFKTTAVSVVPLSQSHSEQMVSFSMIVHLFFHSTSFVMSRLSDLPHVSHFSRNPYVVLCRKSHNLMTLTTQKVAIKTTTAAIVLILAFKGKNCSSAVR